MVSMDTVRIVCSAVCVAEKPGGCLYLLPAPPAVHIAMDRPAGQRVQPVSKQRNLGTAPACAARQAFCQPPRGCLGRDFHTQSGQPRELASPNTIDLGRGAGSAACAGTRGFAAAKKRRGTEAAFGPADLFGSQIQGDLFGAAQWDLPGCGEGVRVCDVNGL